jgi:valyl-tRNA synthetase
MILMTTYATGQVPFKNVYLHGLIRDKNGEKMSKSKPETCIDPLDMINKYGTDSVRLSLVIGGTPGNDIRVYEEKIAGYRNFINKIWNSSQFVLMNLTDEKFEIKSDFDKWILSKLNKLIKESSKEIENYRFSDAGMKIYDFFWSQFCDWYLEASKGELKNPSVLKYVLETLLKLLHPFVPFVTEVIWEELKKKSLLIGEEWPKSQKKFEFEKEEKLIGRIFEIITEIRKARADYKVDPGKKITAIIYSKHTKEIEKNAEPIKRLARLEDLKIEQTAPAVLSKKSKSIFLTGVEIYLPLSGMIDIEKEKSRIKKSIETLGKDIKTLQSKLSNKGFINNAPREVVEKEQTRLEESLANLKKLEEEGKSL